MNQFKASIIALMSAALITGCSSESNQDHADDNFAVKQAIALNSAKASRDSVEQLLAKTMNEIDSVVAGLFGKSKKEEHPNRAKNAGKAEILKHIRLAGSVLKQNRQKIAKLRSQLAMLKIDNGELKTQLAQSDKKLQNYEAQLTALKDQLLNRDLQIADLHHNMENMKFESIMNKGFADKYEDELNTAYYTEGTYKQLKNSGVITRKGGILGLGSTQTLSSNFPEQLFAKIDIRETKSIPVNARKARLVTEHPDSSYELKDSAGMVTSLEIKDPVEFWKISRHMVLVVN